MILRINNNEYMLPSYCTITSEDAYVIIDEVESLSFTSEKTPTVPPSCRLVILFDKARTARWFAEFIKECVHSGQQGLKIQKIDQWNCNFPFGYQYIF